MVTQILIILMNWYTAQPNASLLHEELQKTPYIVLLCETNKKLLEYSKKLDIEEKNINNKILRSQTIIIKAERDSWIKKKQLDWLFILGRYIDDTR